MRAYYHDELRVPKFILDRISDQMAQVRTILTMGVPGVDGGPEVLGVVSVDFFEDQPRLTSDEVKAMAALSASITALRRIEIDHQFRVTRR